MSSLAEANGTQRIESSGCCVMPPGFPTGTEDSLSSWQEGWPLMAHSWVPLWRIVLHLREVALSKVTFPLWRQPTPIDWLIWGIQNEDLCIDGTSPKGQSTSGAPHEAGWGGSCNWSTFQLFPLLGPASLTPHQCYPWVCSPLKLLHANLRVSFPGNAAYEG